MNFQSTFKGRRVLVTGDTGFKGAWLCEWLLAEGAEVYGLGLKPDTEPALFERLELESRIHHSELDIRDACALRDYFTNTDPEIVLHLAAQPLVRLSYEMPVETYATNVMGTVHVLDAIRQNAGSVEHPIAAVLITTDKCYENREWLHSYREEDPVGGHDPYSSSKGACELAIDSFRRSYFSREGDQRVAIASARAGNVIGGGDWASERILPDCIRALDSGMPISVRNRFAARPWQHVLEPLGGYLLLAAELWRGLNDQPAVQTRFHYSELCTAFNFGPSVRSNRPVQELVNEVLKHWDGSWRDDSDPHAPHEARLLNLSIDKAHHMLGWQPRWDFETTICETVGWYRKYHKNQSPARELISFNLERYRRSSME